MSSSRCEGGADGGAGKLPRGPRPRGGTPRAGTDARQTHPARSRNAGPETESLMEKALRPENLAAAYKRVKRNGGAPGVDGMSVHDLKAHCRQHWPRIRKELLGGRYRPQPVKRVEIPKPGGKGTRTLGIPTVLDRMIQQALNQVLNPIFDPTFSDASFGFRPGRSTHDAVRRAREHIASGYGWVVDLDLEKFFDRVNHDVLMARVARRVEDKEVLRLIRRYLQAGMMEGGLVSPRVEGTPQGGPLSPLLSNVLLDELDKELERRGHRFVRYADDCNVYVRSRAAGERVLASLERFLQKRLRLKVNREKCAVGRPPQRKFLSYSVTGERYPRLRVAPQAVRRLRTKLRPIFRRGRGRSLDDTIEELNRKLRGWIQYYRLVEAPTVFKRLDQRIRRKLRCILWRQWKTPATRVRRLTARGATVEDARGLAYSRHGPWVSAGTWLMGRTLPPSYFAQQGLLSLLREHQRLARSL